MARPEVKFSEKKKRTRSPEWYQKPSKTQRIDRPEEENETNNVVAEEQYLLSSRSEACPPWRNLHLILSIQSKEIDDETKVQLAFDYITTINNEDGIESASDFETVTLSRVIISLNDWTQSLLISSEKRKRSEEEGAQSKYNVACLDFRCWEIFKFCLKMSLKVHTHLILGRNLLRAVGFYARNILSLLDGTPLVSKDSSVCYEAGFYSSVLDCISLVFSSHGGLLNANLELWISTVDVVLQLLQKIYSEKLHAHQAGSYVLQFSCLVLKPFSKFLRVHPARKNGFSLFVNKLLEPLLNLLGLVHLYSDDSDHECARCLLDVFKEILSEGLFHPVHMDGFLNLHGVGKYATSHDLKPKDSKVAVKSYHRHLFDKLGHLMAAKVLLSANVGDLLCLLSDRVKRQNGMPVTSDGTEKLGKRASRPLGSDSFSHLSDISSRNSCVLSESRYESNCVNSQTRKSLFDFFVQLMELCLLEINIYLQDEVEIEHVFLEVCCTFKYINNILARFMHEKLYMRTEDDSGGGCFTFLKKTYDMIMSLASKIFKFCISVADATNKVKTGISDMFEEIILSVSFFLEIEYDVIGKDLVSLWLMMLSYLAYISSSFDASLPSTPTSKILALGCQLINLYSELRQVMTATFDLCRAVRLLVYHQSNDEINCSIFMPCSASLSYKACARSVTILICSPDFRSVIRDAIKSIPEGQVCECLRQLVLDVSASLEWMRHNSSAVGISEKQKVRSSHVTLHDVQAEVLGRCLSEIYTLVLDSLTITTGNSYLVGGSVKDLMETIRPSMSNLVGFHPECVKEFLTSVTSITSRKKMAGFKEMLISGSLHWVFLLFFRLYLSCRSLYRQAISLMPPDSSKKMLKAMGDCFTAYCGKDWMEMMDWENMGYFSWIVQPSCSLPVVIRYVSEAFNQNHLADCSPLIYVLHILALQRLVDLNKQIKSFEYLLKRNETKLTSDVCSQYHKLCTKWKNCVSDLRHEAANLTDFMMGFLSRVAEMYQLFSSDDDTIYFPNSSQTVQEDCSWDLSVISVSKNSLPTAIWWILCQNIEIWCSHAAKKKLKIFLSLLIHTCLSCTVSSDGDVGRHNVNGLHHLRRITMQQISLKLISDISLYEQKFVRRHFASRFCRILEKSVRLLPISNSSDGDFCFRSSPNWPEVLDALDKLLEVCFGDKHATVDRDLVKKQASHISSELLGLTLTGMEYTACQSLVNLFCGMPKGYLNSRSFSLYATYIVNFERLAVGSLINRHGASDLHDQQELLRLFLSCRRALRYMVVASCEEINETSSYLCISVLAGCPSLALWILKSVELVAEIQLAFSREHDEVVILSLIDHTSYILLKLSNCQFNLIDNLMINAEQPSKECLISSVDKKDACLNFSQDSGPCHTVAVIANTLKERIDNSLLSLRDTLHHRKNLGVSSSHAGLNKLTSVASCFQGYLWGLTSAMCGCKNYNAKQKNVGWYSEVCSQLNCCVDVFSEFTNFFLWALIFEDSKQLICTCGTPHLPKLNNFASSLYEEGLSLKISGSESETSRAVKGHFSGACRNCLLSPAGDNAAESRDAWMKKLQLVNAGSVASVLAEIDSFDLRCLNSLLLQSMLKGDSPEAAFLLRQLFFGSAAILKFYSLTKQIPFLSNSVPIMVAVSQVLLLEFANFVEIPQPHCFVWLDGVVKYLEELGSHFSLTDPSVSRNAYLKLLDLHINAIGKCICLQGKSAVLASHETESITKTLYGFSEFSEASNTPRRCFLNEFKSGLRTSFKVFINKPSELHLLSVVQALERVLVGVCRSCTVAYEIRFERSEGGNVSPVVAAGIDCLDIVLACVSGRKRLNVLKRHIQTLIASLFNIILHLRGPLIFFHSEVCNYPEPGAVILMCIEVLARISRKQALFQMDPRHVGFTLRIPGTLFRGFCQLKCSEVSVGHSSLFSSEYKDNGRAGSKNPRVVDRRFSLNLYAACCQLLYTVIKHHKSESEQCLALLQDSVSVLLHCLEMVDTDLVIRDDGFAWDLQEGVKCASFFRRIYEEIQQQKDVFGRYSFQFLSSYIWAYSGYGPLKVGIKREIDDALRPGVYALLDVCSTDDLQHLHTVFGEGPCRSTLARLQHDYKLNFQYKGKV